MHKLGEIMVEHDLSIKDVVELAGVSESSIRHTLNGDSPFKVNDKVAELIAAGLYMEVFDIFEPLELSERGRPGGTGGNTIEQTTPLRLVESYETTCTKHFTVYPRSAGCEECA